MADEIRQELRVLRPWQYVVVESFGARVLAPEHAAVGRFADRYIGTLAADDRRDLLRFLGYLEHAAPLASGHAGRFSGLPGPAQDAVISQLELGPVDPLRAAFVALKSLACMAYYRQSESWKALGYSGPVVVYGRRP